MLARRNRFHGLHSLDSVYRRGKTIRGPYCLIRYAHHPTRTDYRAAVVVSKKVNKSAVVRNRIRRRIYAIVRQQPIAPGTDLIITVFDEIVATVAPEQLQQSLSRQLGKLPAAPKRPDGIVK